MRSRTEPSQKKFYQCCGQKVRGRWASGRWEPVPCVDCNPPTPTAKAA